ncbi:MAG TPA: hypothetical protein VNM47_07305 [Terriglobia bacterium]|nr:hypothetical protein [Terriglobia bacterium]
MKSSSIKSIRLVRHAIMALSLSLLFAAAAFASQQSVPVPQVNANLGPCTVDFTVSQGSNQPLYNAEISVKIAYGFMGMKKMDLKVGTNSEGKARFVGLPEKVHNPPLAFVVSAKGLTKTVNYWPSVKCQARYAVVMDGR